VSVLEGRRVNDKPPLLHRTVYAIVKNATGEIEALCLSKRDCRKILRGDASPGGPERIEVMHNVGWPTWDQWLAQLIAKHGVVPRPEASQLDRLRATHGLPPSKLERLEAPRLDVDGNEAVGLEPACAFCGMTRCVCSD